MKLAVFDLDGTLVDSVVHDDALFVQAIADCFGIDDVDSDWSAYAHSTDSGLVAEIIETRLSRPATVEDLTQVRGRFERLWGEAIDGDRGVCRPMAGAVELLGRLDEHPGWGAAIATGAWEVIARRKIAAAGLDVAHMPAAFSDDARERPRIIEAAVGRAAARYDTAVFEQTVYLGDGVWDLEAARSLGMGFIGVGRDAQRLRKAGAARAFDDLRQLAGACEELLGVMP